ncbi:hypothetical protein [Massilia haematophila]|uniref:Uncharacterized protein n=1 Tax=Massilia haematophila TaxID=457923 RepID=A0ABV7PH31_9BURK
MNQEFDIAAHLAALSDDALIAAAKEAQADMAQAAREAPDSERHSECFAGLMICGLEMQKRGLRMATLH